MSKGLTATFLSQLRGGGPAQPPDTSRLPDTYLKDEQIPYNNTSGLTKEQQHELLDYDVVAKPYGSYPQYRDDIHDTYDMEPDQFLNWGAMYNGNQSKARYPVKNDSFKLNPGGIVTTTGSENVRPNRSPMSSLRHEAVHKAMQETPDMKPYADYSRIDDERIVSAITWLGEKSARARAHQEETFDWVAEDNDRQPDIRKFVEANRGIIGRMQEIMELQKGPPNYPAMDEYGKHEYNYEDNVFEPTNEDSYQERIQQQLLRRLRMKERQ
tara:strand:+ start:559 stop:1365 length:807 start_codon:yes stop_codon:yes gene_type:complete